MARGGLVNGSNVVAQVINAAAGKTAQYMTDPAGGFFQFVPDPYCMPGDTYNGTVFTYNSVAPAAVTQRQVIASFAASGFGTQLTNAIVGATAVTKAPWSPPNVTAADTVVVSAATNLGLTAAQLASILAQAANYPA